MNRLLGLPEMGSSPGEAAPRKIRRPSGAGVGTPRRAAAQRGAAVALLRRVPQARILAPLWPFLRPERGRFVLAMVVALLLTVVEVATPLLIGAFVDDLLARISVSPGSPVPEVWLDRRSILLLLLVAAVARGLLVSRQRAMAGGIGERVARRIRDRLWSHVQRLPLDYARRRGAGRMLLRFIGDTRAVQRVVTDGLVRLSQELVLGLAIVVALLVVNVRMAVGVLLILPLYGGLFLWLNPGMRRESVARRRRRSRVSAYLQERISGIAVVKGFAQYQREDDRFRGLNRQLARRGTRLAAKRGQIEGLSATMIAAVSVLVLGMAAREVDAGRLTAGELVAFYALLGLMAPLFQRVVVANRYFQEARISIDRLQATLAEIPESPDDALLPPLEVSRGQVRVEQLGYTYQATRGRAGQIVLRDVSFNACQGELVALVGPNGSGKSTLLDLLLGFRDPTAGYVVIDGQDTRAVSRVSMREQIGSVVQNSPLFDGTIRENIAYALPLDAPDELIERAAWLAGVDEMIAELPDGLETAVGPGGSALSGGQRQRVALARALAGDPPILLLDEATSALDAEAEETMARTLRELAHDKTVIVIAHRLATLRLADRIYVMQQGSIVEEGSHSDLVDRQGVYARLFADDEAPHLVGRLAG